jgi:cytochrome P450
VTGTAVLDAPLYPPSVRPPPRPLPLHQFLYRYVHNPLSGLPQAVYEEPIVVFNARRNVIAWVTSPALVEKVLVKSVEAFPRNPIERRVLFPTLGNGVLTAEGALWRWQRRVIAPLFRHGEILRYVPTMGRAAEDQLAAWRRDPAGTPRPVDRAMTDTTFAVITRTMLAGGEPDQAASVRQAGGDYLENVSWEIVYALLRLPSWVPHPATWRMRRAARRIRASVREIIDRRGAQGGVAEDLLGRLLAARDPDTGAPMNTEQLVNNVLTLLVAGHETTAKALTWTLYLFARAPAWQEAVRQEITSVVGQAPIAGEHIEQLPLTQQVLKEAMRLYPPAPILTRLAAEDVELGGVSLKAGTTIVIPVFAIHRHRRLWDDPDRFDPQRFTAEREARRVRTQFMPFGAGPRTCIGMSFAMAEGTAILATLVRGARFEWDGRHLPEPVSRVTLRPKGGMPLLVHPLGQP